MKLYKIIALLLLIPTIGFANDKKKHEKTKTIHKTFDVNSNATVYISNKYGNVNVVTWDKNTVEFDIKITVAGSDLDKVEDKLDAIDIDFEATKNLVEARTRIESVSSRWSSWWGGSNNNINFKINYTVKMPVNNNVDFHNKYGNIALTELKGKSNINCKYGNIEIDKLYNKNNYINIDYCGNSEVNYIKSGDINADYSKISIEEAETINANADYTTLKVETVEDIDFNTDYGSVSINQATNVIGNSDYASMRLGTIYKNLKINTDYGGLRVKNLAKGFENVTVNGNYAGIKIGTASNNNFDFIVDLSYASFRYPDEAVELFKSIKKTTKKYYEGSFGKGNSGSKIDIKSDYGSVSIKLND